MFGNSRNYCTREDVVHHVRDYCHSQGLFKVKGPVLVSVSAGADSVALFLILLSILGRDQLHIVYIDHRLRESEVVKERAFILALGKAHDVKVSIRRAPVQCAAKKYGESIEMAGRRLRRRIWQHLVKLYGFHSVVTAHHIDDVCESFIMRLVKGTRRQLGLISPKQPFGDACFLLRPLLTLTKDQLLLVLKDQPYLTDSSNFNTDILRNRIRHDVMPIFRDINPKYQTSFIQFLTHYEEMQLYLDQKVASLVVQKEGVVLIDRSAFKGLVLIEKKQVLYMALNRCHLGRFSEVHIDAIIEMHQANITGKWLPMPGNLGGCFE